MVFFHPDRVLLLMLFGSDDKRVRAEPGHPMGMPRHLKIYFPSLLEIVTPSSLKTSWATFKAFRTLGNPVYGIRWTIHPTISSGVSPTDNPVLMCMPIWGLPCATRAVMVVMTFCLLSRPDRE